MNLLDQEPGAAAFASESGETKPDETESGEAESRKAAESRGAAARAVSRERVAAFRAETADLRRALMGHPLYSALSGEEALRLFMRSHVFCVWDFMSLVAALRRDLTCASVPWLPTADPAGRRLVNEIVLDEESDADGRGGFLSHYELYLRAMRECGADAEPILRFVDGLRGGRALETALGDARVPAGVGAFVRGTLDVADCGASHRVAAVFFASREDVIPNMFRKIVSALAERAPEAWGSFRYYLERHIEVDSGAHKHAAEHLIARLCGEREVRWREAGESARAALERRIALWDRILESLASSEG